MKVLGIPVTLHWTWFAVVALYVYDTPGNKLHNLAFVLSLFATILAHEFGHALVAKRLGYNVEGIMLHMLGGAATIPEVDKRPLHELKIAGAGPAVTLVIAACLFPFTQHPAVKGLFLAQCWLFMFNMIPALPLDGGRIARSTLSLAMSSHDAATRHVLRVSVVCAALFVFYGVFSSNWVLVMIGLVVLVQGWTELKQTI